ncbi:MAG: hypothetical protein IJA49_03925 [Oscillospiraceae bacterium]|nr:hypothetical protein [Oscillospiraceae bacterium]
MPVLEWSDVICFGWAIVFLIFGFRFRREDNDFVSKVAQADREKREKVARDWSRTCFINAICLVFIGIASMMDWTAVMLMVFFGMAGSYLFRIGRAWWKDAEEKAQ